MTKKKKRPKTDEIDAINGHVTIAQNQRLNEGFYSFFFSLEKIPY